MKNESDHFKGKIPVSIRCDNSRDVEMIPSDLSDFNLYGGIYRYLNLVYQPAFSIEKLHVNASVDAKGAEGKLELNVKFLQYSALTKAGLKIEIIDPTGKLLTTKALETDFSQGEVPILTQTYKKPLLWSPDQPNLYTCNVTIETAAGSQTVSEYFGFRNFEFVEKGPFKLNGSRLLLRGTHRHEDHAGVAAAMTEPLIRQEMKMMKEMGVNFIRLGHYQQSRIVLNLCDSLGIMVWEEIPWCRGGLGGPKYQQQAKAMLSNMIDQKADIATIEVKLYDSKNILCLNARNIVGFGLAGDGKLIDNQGTSSGSRTVELYNGRAIIRVQLNGGKSVATVKSKGLKTAFLEL